MNICCCCLHKVNKLVEIQDEPRDLLPNVIKAMSDIQQNNSVVLCFILGSLCLPVNKIFYLEEFSLIDYV